MGHIYALHAGDNIYRYVGLTTTSLNTRLISHRFEANREKVKYPVHRWIKKHGVENIVIESLGEFDKQDLPIWEIEFIRKLRGEGFALLNLSSGGYGLIEKTEAHKNAIRAAMVEWKKRPEYLEKVGANKRGSKSHMAKINEDEALDIKILISMGARNKDLMSAYGLSGATISQIRTGKNWRHV